MKMKNRRPIRNFKLIAAAVLVVVTQIAMGSFTGAVNKKSSNLYSLKNFNRNFYQKTSPLSLRAGFQFMGSRFVSQRNEPNGDITVNSMMRFEKGNTTYIYPYTHKVVVPKFKTPTPPALR